MSVTAVRRPPFSVPRQALPVMGYMYLLVASAPALCLLTLGPVLGSRRDDLDDHFLAYLGIVSGVYLGLLFAVRSGRVWGLVLLRYVALFLTGLTAVGLAASAMLAVGWLANGTRTTRLSGQFSTMGFLVCAVLAFLLLRALGRVRWLDPRSGPETWEPPLRRSDLLLGSKVSRRYDR